MISSTVAGAPTAQVMSHNDEVHAHNMARYCAAQRQFNAFSSRSDAADISKISGAASALGWTVALPVTAKFTAGSLAPALAAGISAACCCLSLCTYIGADEPSKPQHPDDVSISQGQ